MAIITSNEDLAGYVKEIIKDSGMKKSALAESIGLSRQGLNNLLNKKSFSIDDAKKILQPLSLSIEMDLSLCSLCPEVFQPHNIQKILKKEK